MARNDDAYCFLLLKEGLSDSSMSIGERAWFILCGAIGTIVVDPVLLICNIFGIKGDDPIDTDDPNHPFNQTY